MNILHINRNYVTTPLHQVMMSHLEKYTELKNSVFAPTDLSNPNMENILKNTRICISHCFNKWDRYVFDLKQHKILSALKRHFNIQTFDLIHAYTLFTDGNCAMKLSETYGIPYIVAIRSTDVNEFFKKLPYLRKRGIQIMDRASAICFLSESYKARVFNKYVPEELHQAFDKKSYIIPNGIDDFWLNNIYTDIHELHSPIRLVYAGRIDANKNVVATIAAIEELAKKGIKAELTVVGAVIDKKIFEKLKNSENVHYHPAVSKERLISFYRDSDVFVMPSFSETFGLVYAEALSQGLPVIYSRGEGFDGQFPEGTVGYHVDPHDSHDIATAIIKITKRYTEIEKSTSECAKKFDWNDITAKYRNLYHEICGK